MGAIKKNRFLKEYSEAVIAGYAAVFAGAGFSATAGFVDWKGLLRDLATEIGLDVEKEHDLVSLAQYYDNEHSREDVTKAIFDNFTRKAKLDDNHLILASLPIKTYWTTNFDSLIEDGLRKCGKRVDVKSQDTDFRNKLKGCNATVYKMHGDINHPDDTILLKREFEDYAVKHAVFHSALMSDMMDKTFLFLGFSFTDPNLNYVLSRMRVNLNGSKVHYNITKEVKRNEYKTDDEYNYEHTKQEHFINDLEKNYHIQTLLVEEWSQINDILKELKKRNDRRTIYISGAANQYQPWDEITCKAFVKELSAKLIASGYHLVTGYGLGVGNLVIAGAFQALYAGSEGCLFPSDIEGVGLPVLEAMATGIPVACSKAGALQEIYKNENEVVDDQITMRPFPIGADKEKVDTNRYRRDMIRNTGISIFLFGNKEVEGTIALSDGMDQELTWSKDQNNILIPVGVTGYKSKQYYDELMAGFPSDEYTKYEANLKIIGDDSKAPNEIIDAILQIVNDANQ